MDWTLEVVIVPVSDLDRSIAFYRDQVGFDLDHDTRTDEMHIAQLTPRGSGCSIVIGSLPSQQEMAPGSLKGMQLVVADAEAARDERSARGSECSEGKGLAERGGGPGFGCGDPDGNTRGVQGMKGRGARPEVPGGARQRVLAYRFGTNLVMYALTGNYKGDQVHVPAILERLGN